MFARVFVPLPCGVRAQPQREPSLAAPLPAYEREREYAHHFRFRCNLTARCCCWLIYVANSGLCPALVACQMQPN